MLLNGRQADVRDSEGAVVIGPTTEKTIAEHDRYLERACCQDWREDAPSVIGWKRSETEPFKTST